MSRAANKTLIIKSRPPRNEEATSSSDAVVGGASARRRRVSRETVFDVLGRQALDQDDRGETVSIEDVAIEFGVELD
jgi:hypothetical protein